MSNGEGEKPEDKKGKVITGKFGKQPGPEDKEVRRAREKIEKEQVRTRESQSLADEAKRQKERTKKVWETTGLTRRFLEDHKDSIKRQIERVRGAEGDPRPPELWIRSPPYVMSGVNASPAIVQFFSDAHWSIEDKTKRQLLKLWLEKEFPEGDERPELIDKLPGWELYIVWKKRTKTSDA